MSDRAPETQYLVNRLSSERGIEIGFSQSATQQLSVNNGSILANSLAHLLCNKANHPIVEGFLNGDEFPEIPMEFQAHGHNSIGHFFYMCGSAPRFVSKSGKHLSQDALRALTANSIGLKFYFWAQECRLKKYGGSVGLPQSFKEGKTSTLPQDAVSKILTFKNEMDDKYKKSK